MVREVDLMSYIPDFLKEYLEMSVIQSVIQPEIQIMEDETENLFKNQFIKNSDSLNLKRYEKMLKIYPLSSDTLEDRRFKILSKWNRMIPYTKATLKNRLSMLCGDDGYLLEIKPQKVIFVRVALKSKRSFTEVADLLEEFTPCDMLIDLDLLYNQYELLQRYTHRQLAIWTHSHIRNEVLNYGK